MLVCVFYLSDTLKFPKKTLHCAWRLKRHNASWMHLYPATQYSVWQKMCPPSFQLILQHVVLGHLPAKLLVRILEQNDSL